MTLAKHYASQHPGLAPKLTFEVLCVESNTLKRKVKEAYFISHTDPQLNAKDEMQTVKKFML